SGSEMTDLNPQARQMANESMVRNLAAQADAIWPQEAPLLDRYALPLEARILDAGCGTGEIASRLAQRFPRATVLGIDIVEAHLHLARSRYADLAPRLAFEHQSVYALDATDGTFDLTVCRHVLQAIPHPDRVLAELARVPRDTFASILEAWRDGYAEPIAQYTPVSKADAQAYFDQMVADIRDPRRYAVWMVPVASARVA